MTEDLKILHKNHIYPIPLRDYLPYESDKYAIYSPLSHGLAVVGTDEAASFIQDFLKTGKVSDAELDSLITDRRLPVANYVENPEDVYAMTILPNNICNFSCSYCYAAKGHSHDQLDEETLRTALDFFINSERTPREHLYISFGGGGEPLLSWQRMKSVLDYAEELASKHRKTIHYSFASNGSVMSPEILDTIRKFSIKVNISFDILENIQNVQRKHYNRVCETLDTLLSNGVYPTINSVITPLNVELQADMVREIGRRFPGLKRLSFDYVVDGNLYETPQDLGDFYDRYIKNFFWAREIGKEFGIEVSSIKYHNLEQLKTRACAGGFDITPQGTISVCFFISSPREKLYEDFIYGRIEDRNVQFDKDKFYRMVNETANTQDKCHECFLKWHCAGGCLFHARSYSPEMLDTMCEFQRKFSIIALLNMYTGQNVLENENALS